jgi:cytochrome c553
VTDGKLRPSCDANEGCRGSGTPGFRTVRAHRESWRSGLALRPLLLAPILSFWAPAANAQELAPEIMLESCASCHGIDGDSQGTIPSLSRLNGATLAANLHGFKSGEIEGTIMNRIVRAYSDAEIDALAAYFAEQRQ